MFIICDICILTKVAVTILQIKLLIIWLPLNTNCACSSCKFCFLFFFLLQILRFFCLFFLL